MLRRLSETFTATHLVAMFGIAVLAPTTLYAVAVSNVTITDANTGATAYVDAGRKLWTNDVVNDYTRNPVNAVNISDLSLNNTGFHTIYTIPSGKALLIKSVSSVYFGNTEGNALYSYLYDPSTSIIYNFEGAHVADSISAVLDPGIVVHTGTLSLLAGGGSNTTTLRTYIQGYLIPAAVAPAAALAAASASEASQIVRSGAPAAVGRPQ